MVSDRKLYVVDTFKKVLKTVFTDYFKIKKNNNKEIVEFFSYNL